MAGEGNINAAYEVNIDGSMNMLNYTANQYRDFVLDPTSSWQVITAGRLKGSIDMDYTKPAAGGVSYTVNSATFCPDGCEVTMNETLRLKAQKKGTQDNIKGAIKSDADSESIYKGTGAFDIASKKFVWKELTVTKSDIRSWSQDLTYNSLTSVHYAGRTSADALLQPTKNLSSIKDHVFKIIKVSTFYPAMMQAGSGFTQTSEGTMDQDQESRNNKLISRTGTGSFTSGYGSGNVVAYSGLYDTASSQMLVTNSLVKSEINVVRRDPLSPLSQYTDTRFDRGSIYVPGFFTATSTDAVNTMLSTPPKKYLPNDFVYMKSFADDAREWSAADKSTMDRLVADLRARGVNVTIYSTQTKQAMLDAYSNVPSGSWVMNSGHGLDNGLWAGSIEKGKGGELVTYAEIMQVLKEKQVKIDVFASDSCFAGRAPIGQTVIGFMGVGFGTNSGAGILQPAGSLLMFNGNLWSGATEDIVNSLNAIAKQNAVNGGDTTTFPTTGGIGLPAMIPFPNSPVSY